MIILVNETEVQLPQTCMFMRCYNQTQELVKFSMTRSGQGTIILEVCISIDAAILIQERNVKSNKCTGLIWMNVTLYTFKENYDQRKTKTLTGKHILSVALSASGGSKLYWSIWPPKWQKWNIYCAKNIMYIIVNHKFTIIITKCTCSMSLILLI